MTASQATSDGFGPRRLEGLKWDRLAEGMPDFYGAPSTQHYRRFEIGLIERHIGSLAGKKVLKLDLWNEAINTRILHWMAAQGAEAYGLDLSRTVVRRALDNAGECGEVMKFLQADVRRLPFADGTFDFVYTMGTIEHFPEYRTALEEIRRVLKPGGRALVGVPYRWDIFLRPLLVLIMEAVGRYPYSPERSFSFRTLRRAVETSGLRVSARTGILFLPGVLRLADLFCYCRGRCPVGPGKPSPYGMDGPGKPSPYSRIIAFFLRRFACLEERFSWARRLGYLIVVVCEKTGVGDQEVVGAGLALPQTNR